MATKKAQEPSVARLFTQLNNEGEDGEYEDALETADKILGIIPDDPDAKCCKVVCLIQISRFDDAIKQIDELQKSGGEGQFLFEKAYCLYRTERWAESLQLLDKMAPGDQRTWDLKAQVLYRLERFSEATSVFESALKQSTDNFGNERRTNYAAALALSGHVSLITQQAPSLQVDTMEQCFNGACCYLAAGMPDEALKAMDLAEERCKAGDEERPDEDVQQELAGIRVLRGYAFQLKGSSEQAMGMYNMVLKQKPSDLSLGVIASNNIIALNRDKDIFDSKKRIKQLAGESGYKKLNSLQRSTILLNRCLFALHTHQLDVCHDLLSELKSRYPMGAQAILGELALLSRERKWVAAMQLLEGHLKTSPQTPLLIYATLAQLHLTQNNVPSACQVLMQCPERSTHVGLVSVLVSMLEGLGEVDMAARVYDEAVEWWSSLPQTGATSRVAWGLMLESAKFKLQHGHPEEGAGLLERLLAQDKGDMRVLALLISAYSRFSPQRAEEASRLLPRYTGGPVDIGGLEKVAGFKLLQRKAVQKAEPKPADLEVKKERKKKKQKKKKLKLPKQYDPLVPPDLERWLPLRERSYYRRGRKKGFSGIGRGTQGSSAATAALTAQLDASKPKPGASDTLNAARGKGEESPQAAPAKKKPQPQQQKKKKKNNKGW